MVNHEYHRSSPSHPCSKPPQGHFAGGRGWSRGGQGQGQSGAHRPLPPPPSGKFSSSRLDTANSQTPRFAGASVGGQAVVARGPSITRHPLNPLRQATPTTTTTQSGHSTERTTEIEQARQHRCSHRRLVFAIPLIRDPALVLTNPKTPCHERPNCTRQYYAASPPLLSLLSCPAGSTCDRSMNAQPSRPQRPFVPRSLPFHISPFLVGNKKEIITTARTTTTTTKTPTRPSSSSCLPPTRLLLCRNHLLLVLGNRRGGSGSCLLLLLFKRNVLQLRLVLLPLPRCVPK